MSANGTVTITAKVDAARAEEALKSLGAAAQKVAVDVRQASVSQRAAAEEATQAVKRQAEATQTLAQKTSELATHTMGMVPHMLAMGAAMGVAMGAIQGVGAAFAFVRDQSATYESAMKTLQTVTVRTGGNFTEAKGLVKEFSDAISSPAAAAQAVRVFNTMNLSMDKQRQLITGIRDGLVAMGMDVNEQLPLMALAIKRQESVLLDNMGVTRTIEMMYKDYAKSIGLSVDQLTQQQKEQAVVNGVLKDLDPLLGSAKDGMDTYKGSVNNLNAALLELGTTAGDKINPHLKFLNNQMANTARELNKLMSDPINVNFPAEPKAKGDLGLPAGFKPTYSLPAGMQRLRTKKEQEEFDQQQAENSRKEAAEAKKRADQRAEEQKRQAQDLRDTLATIGKTGRDLELAQEAIYHRKQMEIAQGNHRNLELEAERHRRVLQGINAKYPPLVMSGANTSAPGLNISMGGGVKGLNLSNTGLGNWSASGGQTLPSANPGSPGDEMWYASIKTATENGLFDAVKSAASADFGGLGQALTSIMSKAPDPMIQAMVGPAGLAITFGSMIIDSFNQAAENAKQYGRRLEDLQPGGPSKSERRQREREDDPIRNRLIGERNIAREQAMSLRTLGGTKSQIDLANQLAEAKQEDIDALDRAQQASWDRADADEKAAWAADKFADAAKAAADASKEHLDKQQRLFGLIEDYKRATNPNYDQEKAGATLDTLNALRAGDGLSALSLDQAREMIMGPGLASDFLSKGDFKGAAGSVDFETVIMEYFARQNDKDRVGPGSTPDRPLYSSIVNFKDMMAFFAPGELFRPQGPGTRRDDGMKGRSVNTRAV